MEHGVEIRAKGLLHAPLSWAVTQGVAWRLKEEVQPELKKTSEGSVTEQSIQSPPPGICPVTHP